MEGEILARHAHRLINYVSIEHEVERDHVEFVYHCMLAIIKMKTGAAHAKEEHDCNAMAYVGESITDSLNEAISLYTKSVGVPPDKMKRVFNAMHAQLTALAKMAAATDTAKGNG